MKTVTCRYEVNDTSAMMKHIEDVKMTNKTQREYFESSIILLKQIQANKKTKIETEEEKDVLKRVYSLNYNQIRNANKKNSTGGLLVKSMVGRDLGNLIDRAKELSDVQDKITINIEKGKADKILLNYIAPTIEFYEEELARLDVEDKKLQREIDNFEKNGVCQFKKTITKEIENPLYGAYITDGSHEYYKKEEGWEWTEYYNLKMVEKQYPERVGYGISDEHPEYAVVVNGLFDLNGKLLKAIRTGIFTPDYNTELFNPVMYAVCAIDYKNNKYNIKQESEATQKWIRLCLELENPQMSEDVSKNLNNSLANAAPALGRSRKQQKSLDKKAGTAMAEAMFSRFDYFDDKGNKYVKQLKSDHMDDFYAIYSVERYDDLSFKILYINSKGESTYAAKITFVQTKPFSYALKTSLIGPDHSVKVKVMTRVEYTEAVRKLGLDDN